jgi:hypothetical protein
MKFKYVLILLLTVFMIIGCDDDSSTTAAVDPCIALLADMIEKSTAFVTGIESGSFENATDCTDYIAAAQAYFDAGCSSCEASDEACAADGTNEDTCCDEIDQAGIDQMSAVCN